MNLSNNIIHIIPDIGAFYDYCLQLPDNHCAFGAFGCLPNVSDLKLRSNDCVACGHDFIPNIAKDRFQAPLVLGDDHDGWPGLSTVVAKNYAIRFSNLGISLDVAQAISGKTGLRFISAAESALPLSGEVDAVGLPFDLTDTSILSQYLVSDTMTDGSWRLDTNTSGLAMASPAGGIVSRSAAQQTAPMRVGRAVYSRKMGTTYLLGLPDGRVDVETLYGPRATLGWLSSGGAVREIVSATVTRPQSWLLHQAGTEQPAAYMWTVERDDTGTYLSVRELTFDGIQTEPLLAVAMDAGEYELATAWDRPNEVLLTLSTPSAQWALFKVSYDWNEDEMQHRFTFDAELATSMFAGPNHLFRGIFAEDGGVVVPLGVFDEQMYVASTSVERVRLGLLGFASNVDPQSLSTYAAW